MPDNKKKATPNPNRSVPYNTEAEMYVLGCVFIENKLIDGLVGKILDNDFYDDRNKIIYKAMLILRDNKFKIDVLTVIDQLKKMGYADIEGMNTYLIELIDSVPSTATIDVYSRIVEDNAIQRRLLNVMRDLSDDILDHKYDVDEQLDNVDTKIKEIIRFRKTSEFVPIGKAASDVYEQIKAYSGTNKELTGLDTGFPGLNKATLGLQKGELIILAARPSVGKSAYAVNLALNVAKQGKHVALFSLEMSIEQLMMRIFSYQAQIPLGNIRSGSLTPEELLLLGISKEELNSYSLYFDENPSSYIADIRKKCRELDQAGKLDLIVIDYLQLITSATAKGSRQEEVSQISRQLKMLAQELKVPIVALSQLSRGVTDREDKRPILSDLRESGSIEQDADMVFFLYRRSDVEGKDTADQLNENVERLTQPQKKDEDNKMEEIVLSIAKNRQGPLKEFDYHFYGYLCRFSEQKQFKELVPKRKNNGMRNLNKDYKNN